jgi:hypothetical protein
VPWHYGEGCARKKELGGDLSGADPPYSGPPDASRLRREPYYRERAREIRELATRTPHAEVRQDLIALSLRYEHLADRAKALSEKAPNCSHPSGDPSDARIAGASEPLPEPE